MWKIYLEKFRKVNIFRGYIIFCIIFFMLGIILGITDVSEIDQLNIGNEIVVRSVFINNMKVGVSMLCIGTLTGGIYGICILIVNGYIVGQLIQFLHFSGKGELIIRGIIPHIGLELAGLICFSTIGFVPIVLLVNWIRNREKRNWSMKFLLHRVVMLLCTGTLLLVVAAILECKVSSIS